MYRHSNIILSLIVPMLVYWIKGELILKYYPKQTDLKAIWKRGKTLMYCEVESDGDFKLKWYKDGRELSPKTKPPWQFPFPDNSGTTVVQWPYIQNRSRGTYKCEATDGKKTLSHTVRYIPVKREKLPDGFPKVVKTLSKTDKSSKYFGTNLTLDCDVTGEDVEILWLFGYIPLHKKFGQENKDDEGFDYRISPNKSRLEIYNLRKVEPDYIRCFAANAVGMIEVGEYYLKTVPVPIKPIPPTIISRPKNISVGGPEQWIDFWCNATGTPAPTYSWWHDDGWIALETDSPKVSLVAMKTGFIRCEVKNEAGTDNATAYITVKPLPFRANEIKLLHERRTTSSFTFKMTANYREAEWHPDIPITYAVIDYRRWHPDITWHDPYKSKIIRLDKSKPHGPWIYTWGNLRPFTMVDIRIRFGNRYGIGNVSKWQHDYSEWGEMTEPVRNLEGKPTSNQSFTLYWQNPEYTNGPVKRYEVFWKTDRFVQWRNVAVGKKEGSNVTQSYSFSWRGTALQIGYAPVVYWKVEIYGFVNRGPTSAVHAFRVCLGAPGNVSNVEVAPLNSTSLKVTWAPTDQPGYGIIGHKIIYNRKDQIKDEKDWKYIMVEPEVYEVTISNLRPNREYNIIVFPRSTTSIGVPSEIKSGITEQAAPSKAPQQVRAHARSSETIEVMWQLPDPEYQNGPIRNYSIYFSKPNRQPKREEVMADVFKFLLQGLSKLTEYKIWVVAGNAKGNSPKSPSVVILTKEKVPQGAPRSVRAFAINDTSIALTWLPPGHGLDGGRIVGYKIYCKEIYKGQLDQYEHDISIVGADARDGIFTKWIRAERTYQFQVAAYTNNKVGTRSAAVVIQTPKALPQAPQVQLEAKLNIDLTTNYVNVKWWLLTENVKQFKITYGKTLRKYDMLTGTKVKLVQSNIQASAFNYLSSGVYYCFKISAELKDNMGWTAEAINWVKTLEGLPSGAPLYLEGVTESASTIRIKFDEPDPWKQSGKITGYRIRYKSNKDFDWLHHVYQLKRDEDSVVYILEKLLVNTRYEIKVCALTAVGDGPYTQAIEVKTNREVLPMVEGLSVMEVKTNSAYIHWKKPNLNKFQTQEMKYHLLYIANKQYRDSDGTTETLQVNKSVPLTSTTTDYMLENLVPGTKYRIEVRVELVNAGIGAPTQVKISTDILPPKEIKAPVIDVEQNMPGYIPIQLNAASEEYGVINHYLLFVINLKKVADIPSSLKPENFGTSNTRQKRGVTQKNSTVAALLTPPEYYIAAFLKRTEVPMKYKLGTGDADSGYKNDKLTKGYYYSTFLRAYVRQDDGVYLTTDSSFSIPVQYVPTATGVTEQPGMKDEGAEAQEAGGSNMVVIIAVTVSVVLLLVIIILAIFIYRRRGDGSVERDRLLSRSSKKSSDPAEIHRQNSTTPGMAKHPPIQINLLARHVEQLKANSGAKYLLEFESIDPGIKPAAEASNLLQNRSKNRYGNVVAFDETRVKLDYDGTPYSDYVNANYIDGYCREKAYIATQGPLKATINDFWRLCWEQNVFTVVMMTKCEERGRNKCEEYWPVKGFDIYSNVRVELKEERMLCNYCIRTFLVSSTISGEERILRHFQYLQWPDPGVPENPGPVLSFVRRVKSYQQPGSGPTLVHCSAGIGRSACFIAIDAMLERLKYESQVDIYGYVTMMRSQRNFMIQTDEQYIFIYDVIVEAIDCGNTEITLSKFVNEYKRLNELSVDGVETGLERQFKSIALNNQYAEDQNLMLAAQNVVNVKKNRSEAIIPFDKNRVVLQTLRSYEGSDYINASFVNGYSKQNAFIATQGPMEHTIADFWRMVMEVDSGIIVMLTNVEEKGEHLCSQYWPTTKAVKHHYYLIDPVQENRFANFVVREFKVTDPRDGKARHVRQYHYLNWSNGRVPDNTEGILELIGQVQKASAKIENDGPVVVHSSTGNGRTGVYIALNIALECLRKDEYIDMFQVVKQLRYERPYMIQTQEQYEYCYHVVNDYFKNFDHLLHAL